MAGEAKSAGDELTEWRRPSVNVLRVPLWEKISRRAASVPHVVSPILRS